MKHYLDNNYYIAQSDKNLDRSYTHAIYDHITHTENWYLNYRKSEIAGGYNIVLRPVGISKSKFNQTYLAALYS